MSLNSDFYFDNRSLSALKYEAKTEGNQQASLKKVSQQFEAFFIKMMLKSMRDASSGEGLFDSQSTQFYRDMFDDQLSVTMAKRGSFGISNLIADRVASTLPTENLPPKKRSIPDSLNAPSSKLYFQSHHLSAERTFVSVEKMPISQPMGGFSAESPAEFVALLKPYATAAAKQLGINPKVLIAQAALETGWGKKIPKQSSGQSSFNLFGIKADRRWQGEKVVINTLEFEAGRFVSEKAAFRAYPSVKESIDDYVHFIQNQPRYKTALANSNDAERYLHELKRAGYATDPEYDHKIIRIMQGRFMTEGVDQIKS